MTRLRPRYRTILRAAALALACCAVLPCAARAQSVLEQLGAQVDTMHAAGDSTAVDSLTGYKSPDELELPTYTSNYGLNRTETTWKQGLSLTVPRGRFTFKHSTIGTLTSDTSRNQRDNRDLNSTTSITYVPATGMTLGLTYDVPRTTLTDFASKNGTTRTDLSLTAGYTKGLAKGMTLEVSGAGGRATDSFLHRTYTTSHDVNNPDQSDDSHGSGVSGSANASLSYAPIRWLVMKPRAARSGSRRDTHQETRFAVPDTTVGDTNHVETVTNIDDSRDQGATVIFTPRSIFSGVLDLSSTNAQAQYFDPNTRGGGGQETRTTDRQKAVLTLNVQKDATRAGNVQITLGDTEVRYKEGSIRSTHTGTLNVTANLTSWRMWGATITGQFSSDSTRIEYLDTGSTETTAGTTGNTYTRNMRLDVSRPLSRKTSMSLGGSLNLIQYAYDDFTQDRDVGNQRAQLTLGYVASPRFTLGLTVSAENKDRFSIHRSQSKNSNSEQVYAIAPTVAYTLARRLQITQKYQLQTDYTVYRFDEDRNFYTGTWSVTNGIEVLFFHGAKIQLSHYQQLREGGSYKRFAPGEPRLFSKANENRTNDLTVALTDTLTKRITVSTSVRLNRITGYTAQGENLTRTAEQKRYDLNGGTTLSYALRDGTSLNVNVRRVSSTSNVENYWTVTADLKKVFFQ